MTNDKMATKPWKKQKENPAGCAEEGKRLKGNITEGPREGKAGTVLELSLEISDPCKVGCHMRTLTGH